MFGTVDKNVRMSSTSKGGTPSELSLGRRSTVWIFVELESAERKLPVIRSPFFTGRHIEVVSSLQFMAVSMLDTRVSV